MNQLSMKNKDRERQQRRNSLPKKTDNAQVSKQLSKPIFLGLVMSRVLILTMLAGFILTLSGCWPYPLVSSKEAILDSRLIGQWRCTELADIDQEDEYRTRQVKKCNVMMHFERATNGLHEESIPKHVMLYHPNYRKEMPFSPPYVIGETPDKEKKVYCWATQLRGSRYLIFQFFEGPIQTDLKRRKDPEFLIYRYSIRNNVLKMFDLDQKMRELIGKRIGTANKEDLRHSEMQREILRIRDRQWQLHVRAERMD